MPISFLVTPVYAAGEQPIPGIDQQALVAGLKEAGVGDVRPVEDAEDLADKVTELAVPADMVICLGAGTISAWANGLPAALSERLAPGECGMMASWAHRLPEVRGKIAFETPMAPKRPGSVSAARHAAGFSRRMWTISPIS